MDGAAEKIDWFLDTAAKYGIKVLLDVHALKDSQNGFDNSGKTSDIVWLTKNRYIHNGNAHWMGNWNGSKYDWIN